MVSKGGLALAEQIVSTYIDSPSIKAVMVGGSVSRGYADRYSDLEIGVFWSDSPMEAERKSAVESVGGKLLTFDESPRNELYALDEAAIRGNTYRGTAMVSTQHLTVAEMEKGLVDVLDSYDTSLDNLALMAAVRDGIPLHGDDLLRAWQGRVAAYPTELAIKIIQENLWFGPWFCAESYAGRDDILVLNQHFLWIEQNMLQVLAALNRTYYPSPEHKWIDQLIAGMKLSPPDLASRLKQVFRVEPLEGWHLLKALIYETLDLIELHLPEVNTVSLFESHPEVNIAWARKRWNVHPPYSLMGTVGDSMQLAD